MSLESWIVEKVGRGQKSRIDKRRENRVAVFRFQRFVSNVKGLERERERERLHAIRSHPSFQTLSPCNLRGPELRIAKVVQRAGRYSTRTDRWVCNHLKLGYRAKNWNSRALEWSKWENIWKLRFVFSYTKGKIGMEYAISSLHHPSLQIEMQIEKWQSFRKRKRTSSRKCNEIRKWKI